MPFTLAHPSAILPFKNKYFNFSGLILGSMAPDFIYFILFSPSSNIGHTFLGFLILNLPMCFILNYIFYKYIQEILILSLPNFISNKYMYITKYKNKIYTPKGAIKFIYSCLIGMLTHVLWDSFTHKTGFFVENLEVLRKHVTIFEMNIPLYKIIQHGSTMIGFLIIFIYIYKIRNTNKNGCISRVSKSKLYLSILSIFIFTMVLFISIFIITGAFIGVGRLVVTFINSILIAYLLTGVIFHNRYKNAEIPFL